MPNSAVWIVVEVRSGIPVSVKAFPSYESADEYSVSLRDDLNLDNDETGVFQINLESISS